MAKEYKSNFLTRTITGLIITAPLAGIVILENYWVLTSFISIVSLAGYYEWVKNGFRHPILWGFNLIFIYFCLSICLMAWILSFPSSLFRGVYELYELSSVSFYNLIILIILNTTLFDIFAYIIGSNFGKRHISPVISPNKTLEGLVGGLGVNVIYGLCLSHLFNLSYWSVLICLLGGFLAFYGDLLISFHKREKSIKDTGKVLPGHGGVLDRIDSHLIASPVMLLLFIIVTIL